MKNPQFFPNPYETWGKYSSDEVIILTKFHKNWAKIADFLLGHSDIRIAFLIKLQLYLFLLIGSGKILDKYLHKSHDFHGIAFCF